MENYINHEQDRRLKQLEDHFNIINSEMGAIKADVKWLKWWMKLMIASQFAVILALLKLIFN